MPDQNQNSPLPTGPVQQPAESGASYGPFTASLTDPLSINPNQAAVTPRPSGFMGKGGALAMYADKFLAGLQQGRRAKLEKSEKQKAERERNFDSVYQHIINDPKTSKEGKEAAEAAYVKAKWGPVHEELSKVKDTSNPMIHFAKTLGAVVGGPTSDPNHRDFGEAGTDKKGKQKGSEIDPVHQLLAVANNPKYKIDPDKIRASALGEVQSEIQKMQNPAPAAQQPGQPPAPAVQPQSVTQSTVMQSPAISAIRNKYRQTTGHDLFETQDGAAYLQSIPGGTTTAVDQAHIRNLDSEIRERDERNTGRTPITYRVTDANGKTQDVGGLIDRTGNRFDTEGNPLQKGDPRLTGPIITKYDAVAGVQTKANTPKFSLKTTTDGTLVRVDANSGKEEPITDSSGKAISADPATRRMMFHEAQANARHNDSLENQSDNQAEGHRESLWRERGDLLAKKAKATGKEKQQFDDLLKENEQQYNRLVGGAANPASSAPPGRQKKTRGGSSAPPQAASAGGQSDVGKALVEAARSGVLWGKPTQKTSTPPPPTTSSPATPNWN